MLTTRSASSFKEAMRMGAEVYHNLKSLIKEKYGEGGGGGQGGAEQGSGGAE